MAQRKEISSEEIIKNKFGQLFSNSKGLNAKIPFDGLQLNRNLDQLYNILKKKNQVARPLTEEAKARVTFKLTETGFESSEFVKKIKEEKYKINTKKEESGIKKASKFFTTLESRYDINSYLTKYADYMLYNLTDNAFIQGKDRFMKKGIMKIKDKWSKQAKDWKRINPINNRLTTRARFITERTNEEISGKKREYFKHFQNYVYVNYIQKDKSFSVANLCHQFISINKEDNMAQDLWRIVSAQVTAAEESGCIGDLTGSQGFEILSDVNATYLEEVFCNELNSSAQDNDVTFQQHGVRGSEIRFIEQEYLSRVDSSLIEKDNGMPIWAIIYLYFRSGKFYEMKQFIDGYKGRIKGNLHEFDENLRTYFQRNRKMTNKFANEKLAGSKSTSGDVFHRMLLVILARHDKVPSEELISNMEDFIWFNLRVCKFQEEDIDEDDDIARVATGYGTLYELQKKILGVDPRDLDSDGSNPYLYIKTLFLVGAYDEALKYMEQYEELQEERVHFAIVLQEAGLLGLRKRYEEEEAQGFELLKASEYHKLVIDYTNTFFKKNFIEALYYLKLLLVSPYDPCPPNLIKKTLSDTIIKNDQVAKIFKDRKVSYDVRDILGAPIFNEIVKQIGQQSKDNSIIFDLFESVKDYEGIFKLIFEDEYKSYEKFKSEEVRTDKKAGPEILAKFKFLEEAFKKYRYNSKISISKYFEMIDFVKRTRAIFTHYIKKEYKAAFETIKFLDQGNKLFGSDERKMQAEFLSKDPIEKACLMDILLFGSKVIKLYKEQEVGTAEEKKDKNLKCEQMFKRLRVYYDKVNPAFEVNKRELIEALKKELELSTTL